MDMVVDIESHDCPCCSHGLHRIGEEVSEKLAVVPARIEGGIPTEATVAQVLVSRYADHLTLYRQAQSISVRGSIVTARHSRTGSAAPPGICARSIDDGRIEIDSNTVERLIRPIALNRKNALFAGSDVGAEHCATIASLVETAKLNDVEPMAYLTDVINKIVNGHPNSRLDELLPWLYRSDKVVGHGYEQVPHD